MKSEEPRDKTLELIDSLTRKIREHCDTVQVFVTLHRDDECKTTTYEIGFGNFYARQGQVQEWITIQEQYQKNYAIRKDKEE